MRQRALCIETQVAVFCFWATVNVIGGCASTKRTFDSTTLDASRVPQVCSAPESVWSAIASPVAKSRAPDREQRDRNAWDSAVTADFSPQIVLGYVRDVDLAVLPGAHMHDARSALGIPSDATPLNASQLAELAERVTAYLDPLSVAELHSACNQQSPATSLQSAFTVGQTLLTTIGGQSVIARIVKRENDDKLAQTLIATVSVGSNVDILHINGVHPGSLYGWTQDTSKSQPVLRLLVPTHDMEHPFPFYGIVMLANQSRYKHYYRLGGVWFASTLECGF